MESDRVELFLRQHGGAFIASTVGTPCTSEIAVNAIDKSGNEKVMVWTSSKRLEKFQESLTVSWRYIPEPLAVLEILGFPLHKYRVEPYAHWDPPKPARRDPLVNPETAQKVEDTIELIESMGLALALSDDETIAIYGTLPVHDDILPSIVSMIRKNKCKYIKHLEDKIWGSIDQFTSRLENS